MAQALAQDSTQDMGWPRVLKDQQQEITIYQPQVESWHDNQLSQRAAVAVESPSQAEPIYGVLWISARTEVDKAQRIVALEDIQIPQASFPSHPEKTAELLKTLRQQVPGQIEQMSLDRLQASLAITKAESKRKTTDLKNDPPQIFYSATPASLILIDGKPVLKRSENPRFLQVINTRAFMILDEKTAHYYLFTNNTWMQASIETGPWTSAADMPEDLHRALEQVKLNASEHGLTDPSPGTSPNPNAKIFVSTEPAELIETKGPPDLEPITTTNLLYIKNSPNHIFVEPSDQKYYVILSGRWFRAKSLDGPWKYIAPNRLPADFAKIPETHPEADVLSSVPGTAAANEAVVSNEIPQTAVIDRQAAMLNVVYDGPPQFAKISGTHLMYATNTATYVVEQTPTSFYAVQNGVWFTASNPEGPWTVATNVPPEIYSIPSSSPVYPATFVYVYGATPRYVYTGYLPGYFGSYVSPAGTIVFGTGYHYHPWIHNFWYGYPGTYGYGFWWTAGYGWGFHPGWYRPWWGPWRAGYAYNVYHSNVYAQSWPRALVASSTITPAATAVRPLAIRAMNKTNNVYADSKGNILRQSPQGWEKYEAKQWKTAPHLALDSDRIARERGEARAQQFHPPPEPKQATPAKKSNRHKNR